jgi:hypothetical protein
VNINVVPMNRRFLAVARCGFRPGGFPKIHAVASDLASLAPAHTQCAREDPR